MTIRHPIEYGNLALEKKDFLMVKKYLQRKLDLDNFAQTEPTREETDFLKRLRRQFSKL